MRNDNEQLEAVFEKEKTALGVKARKRRLVIELVAAVVALTMIVGSIFIVPALVKKNETGEELRAPTDGEERYILNGGKLADKVGKEGYDPYIVPGAPDGTDYAGKKAEFEPAEKTPFGDIDINGTDVPFPTYDEPDVKGGDRQTDHRAGQLTGAELCDRNNFDSFVRFMKELAGKNTVIGGFDTYAYNRIAVTVKNGDTPLSGVKVVLKGQKGDIYKAVTDNKGFAYLFYNIGVQSSDQPTGIEVLSGDGKTAYADIDVNSVGENGAQMPVIDIQLDAESRSKKLDLMFLVDTTGSMGDELEYLKSEITDIIGKVNDNGNLPVRTSVNFYRDEGDLYVVHATPFTTNVSEVYSYIAKERADGGGDYEEAVHTALNDAVNNHNWDENAEKLLFIVLDAPPHSNSTVYASLKATVAAAAEKGIRIIPIVSSGSDALTEYLMRTYAVLTGGTYTFLTDHSGIGNSHSTPDTDYQYTVEQLNDMIVRIVKEYCA